MNPTINYQLSIIHYFLILLLFLFSYFLSMHTTRFAPSPTGKLHIGSVRTALFCYLLSKQSDGKYILRIEDTDQARSTTLFEENILDGFQRLGIDRDAGPEKEDEQGPYYQMKRLEIYNQYVQKLLDSGHAYYARESSEELDAMRDAANKQKKPFHYREISYSPEQIKQYQDEWRVPVIRFKVPVEESVTFDDRVKGETTFEMKQFGDFVIVKGDGIPTYHFAVVVDDILMGITDVIRGEDHLTNTAKHMVLFNAFGAEHPRFGHLPLLMNKSGKKMSKRDDPAEVWLVLVDQFRDEGFLPEAIINFIALMGWNPGTEREFFTLEELVKEFSMQRVQKSNAVYDFKRALWFNSEYIKKLSDENFITKVKDHLYLYGDEQRKEVCENIDQKYRLKLAPYIKVRIQTLKQFADHCMYFFYRPAWVDPSLVNREKMKIDDDLVHSFLPDCLELLEHLSEEQRTEETLKDELIDFIQAKELKNGQVLRPLRAILTWVEASPGAFEMLYVLWKEESLVRLKEYEGQIGK